MGDPGSRPFVANGAAAALNRSGRPLRVLEVSAAAVGPVRGLEAESGADAEAGVGVLHVVAQQAAEEQRSRGQRGAAGDGQPYVVLAARQRPFRRDRMAYSEGRNRIQPPKPRLSGISVV